MLERAERVTQVVASPSPPHFLGIRLAAESERNMPEKIAGNIYDYPRYYDLIFGSDWKAEVDFFEACFAEYGGKRVERLFEPACGTGRLLFRLAKLGYEVAGLDLNPRAVTYCNRRLVKHGFPPSAVVGDMTAFQLPRTYHAAFNTINSFRHLATEKLARQHLLGMAEALAPGGIYLLGLHLTPTEGKPTEDEAWSARRGHLCVNTRMWLVERNLKHRKELYAMTYDVFTPTSHLQIEDRFYFRTYTQKQLKQLLTTVPQFRLVAVYDFRYDIDHPIEIDARTEDVVLVLRREGRP
jgi:SAM-dependent methyltransferase